MKKKIIGMYGGKFLPVHKGHLYCIDVASKECDEVYVIIFTHGAQEEKITDKEPMLLPANRIRQLEKIADCYSNIKIIEINIAELIREDGSDDWDKETPLVRQYLPGIDIVYSSEPSYDNYFKKAYPEAKHRIVDAKRHHVPISSTMIRAMKTMEEKTKWLV